MQQTRRNIGKTSIHRKIIIRKGIVSSNLINQKRILFLFKKKTFSILLFRNLVRNSRRSQLQSVDGSASEQVSLGKQGKDFEFGHLNQTVDFVECSSKECDLENVHTWIQAL